MADVSASNVPNNLVSFPRLEGLLHRMREQLTEEQRVAIDAEFQLALGFLQQFPKGFYSPVPYPENQPGQFVYAVVSPPRRWP